MNLKPINLKENKQDKIYATPECQQLLSMYDDFYPKIGFVVPWIAYFVMKEGKVVGSCGFVGQPNEGQVEIAYWTFKEFEGQGIASYACKELVSIALHEDPNLKITAKTAPEQNASTKILEKNGFSFTGIVQDEEIGDAWQWVYLKSV